MKTKGLILLFCLAVIHATFLTIPAQAIRYVDASATGANDGTSWADAFTAGTSIQAAVTAAAGDVVREVHIAEGTYSLTAEIAMAAGVSLLGGYPAGGGTRNVSAHETILVQTGTARLINVNAVAGVTIDGLTIFGGSQPGTGSPGGGIRVGGASSNTVLNNLRVLGNTIASQNGGGIGIQATATNTTISNSIIAGNVAPSGSAYGGGIFPNSGTTTIENCLVIGNSVPSTLGGGGGIGTAGGTSTNISNTVIAGNWVGGASSRGSGAVVNALNTLNFANCSFFSNSGGSVDTGQVARSGATINLTNTIIARGDRPPTVAAANLNMNYCLTDVDSGTYSSRTNHVIGDPTFVMYNLAAITGVWTEDPTYDSGTKLTTFVDEEASYAVNSLKGRFILFDDSGYKMGYIWSNTETEILVVGDASATAAEGDTYRFVDFHLSDGSPAIDSGTATGAPATDIEGMARVEIPGQGNTPPDDIVDIGAYEAQPSTLEVASSHGSPTPDVGTHTIVQRTGILASVDSPVEDSEGTRHHSTGWSGTGSVPGSGATTSVLFTASEPASAITWLWQTEHLLSLAVNPSSAGSITVDGGASADWYSEGTSVELEALPASGYAFDSWSGAVSSTDNPISVTMDGPRSIQANFSFIIYTVTFDAQGGTTPSPQTKQVALGSPYGTLATTSRDGYNFIGWFTDPTAGSLVTAATISATAGDHTLYARWSADVALVSFDAQGGTTPDPESKLVTFGMTYGALATTSRVGHTFVGWFTEPTGGVEVTAASLVATTANHTLYAQWTANTYTVTFDAQGGTTPDPENKQVTFAAAYGALATTTRVGHTFAGWFTAAEGGEEVTGSTVVAVAANHTLYARWTINTHTLAYTAGEGGWIEGNPNQTVDHGSDGEAVEAVPEEGYRFLRWSDGSRTNPRTDTNVTESIAVEALFTDAPPTAVRDWTRYE